MKKSSASDQPPPTVARLKPSQFIKEVKGVIASGGGFVPFIGSGCSAPSGVLMGREFDEYLACTVYRCVASIREMRLAATRTGSDTIIQRRWDLRRHGWPERPSPQEVKEAKLWIRGKFDEICDRNGFEAKPIAANGAVEVEMVVPRMQPAQSFPIVEPDALAKALLCPLVPGILRASKCPDQKALRRLLPIFGSESLALGGQIARGISPTSEDAIVERAIRSLYDWRATLNFLSELKLVQDTLLVEEPDSAVIDSFNVHLTQGRRPNLTHNMMCHLSGPARFRVILTTNFDTLIEEAFQQMKEDVEVISVSVKGTLPDPDLVHARNTIVKMHGTLWETRADFSLDASPSLESRRRFFHYVQGRYPDEIPISSNPSYLPSQLLVCGYSGNDNLCMEMIKYLIDAGGPESRVFWICHSRASLDRLENLFSERSYAYPSPRIIATWTDRPDLMFYELYQHLCLSLPRGGFSYQYTPSVPPKVRLGGREDPGARHDELRNWFNTDNPASAGESLKIIDGQPGVLQTLRNLVDTLAEERRSRSVWLELEDYADTFCLAYELLLTMSVQLGLFQLGHADLAPEELRMACDAARKETSGSNGGRDAMDAVKNVWVLHLRFLVSKHFNIVPAKWLIVLYGRNGPGGCAGWGRRAEGTEGESSFWTETEFGSTESPFAACNFPPFVNALTEIGFKVIYAPYTESRRDRDSGKWKKLEAIICSELQVSRADLQTPKEPTPSSVEDRMRWLEFEGQYQPVPIHSKRLIESQFGSVPLLDGDASDGSKEEAISFQNSMSKLLREWIRDKRADEFPKDYLKCLRLLYSLTLFRQSRHYSAFLSEAVFPCPNRFNTDGFDNDWLRDKEVEAFREKLFEYGLFYEKPGGFAWAYRDFRLGVRRMLESLPRKFREDMGVENFVGWRSHHHYWIADWYLRAFYTTGNATPLMEALHHLYQCIRCLHRLRENKPAKDRAWRRYRRWRNAVCDMTKAIRIGGNCIRLWFGPPHYKAWFGGQLITEILEDIRKQCPKGIELFPEAGNEPKRSEIDQHSTSLVDFLQAEFLPLSGRGTKPRRAHLKSFGACLIPQGRGRDDRDDAPQDDSTKGDPDFWQVMPLRIQDLLRPSSAGPKESLWKRVKTWQRDQLEADFEDRNIFYTVQELNEWAFLTLRRAKMRQLLYSHPHFEGATDDSRANLGLDDTGIRLWTAVCVLCNVSLEFCRSLHPGLDTFEQKERVKAQCLYAVGLARLGRFFEAHRRLNEANALLSKIDTQSAGVLLGILKLRRAEVHLQEAMLIATFRPNMDGGEIRLPSHLDRSHILERYPILTKPQADGRSGEAEKESDAQQCSPRLEHIYAMQIAKLDDAWCCLEKAERLLAGQLHSARWWARLCALKLRCLLEQPLSKGNISDSICGLRPLSRRSQAHPIHEIIGLIHRGVASSQGHDTLRLRIADYAVRAARNWSVLEPGSASLLKEIKAVAGDVIQHPPGGQNARHHRAQQYAAAIKRMLDHD